MNFKNEILRKAYDGSYYTITGAGGDSKEWIDEYNEMLEEHGIGKPEGWIKFTGHDLNVEFNLMELARYPRDLTFLAFPIEGLNIPKLAIFKLRMCDRWFDDIIDNDLRVMGVYA